MTKRERGTGRIFQPRDPHDPTRNTQVWWIDYSIEGKRYRESSKSRKRSVAAALLKQRLGQAPEQAAARAQKLTFEDLEEGIVARYKLAGNRSTGRLKAAFNHLREHFAEPEAEFCFFEKAALHRFLSETPWRALKTRPLLRHPVDEFRGGGVGRPAGSGRSMPSGIA